MVLSGGAGGGGRGAPFRPIARPTAHCINPRRGPAQEELLTHLSRYLALVRAAHCIVGIRGQGKGK